MESRTIPGTSMDVSPICLGTMGFGTPVSEAEGIRIVHWALDHGVNFVDTANMYEGYTRHIGSPGGVSEDILGKALADRRDEAVLATKVGMKIGPNADDGGLSPAHIARECDRSLDRLGTDRFDVYYMHQPDPETPVAESIAAFVDLIQAGKVLHWGLSNFDAAQTREVLRICDSNRWQRPVLQQPPYSLIKRDIEEGLLPLCREESIAVASYRPLEGGILTGKYGKGEPSPPGSRGDEKPEWIPLAQDPVVQETVRALEAEAREQGLSLFDFVIRTTVNTPGITSIVLGVKRVDQLGAAFHALGNGE